jgi:signal transduction histidine kinase
MLLDDHGRRLDVVASLGLASGDRDVLSLSVGAGAAGRVMQSGKPLILTNVKDDFSALVPSVRPASSSLSVPVRVQGVICGVLSLSIEVGSFADEDLRLAQAFADQAAALVHRGRLYEQAEQRSSDLMALVESSRELVGGLDHDALLQRALDGAARLSGATDGIACLFDPVSGSPAKGVFRGFDMNSIREILATPEIAAAIASHGVCTIEHTQGWMTAAGLETSRSTKGVIVVVTEEEPSPARVDLLGAFAQQCSAAIGSAELHSEIDRKESQMSSIIHAVANPIVVADAGGRITAVNPAAEQLFQVSGMFMRGCEISGALGHPEVEAFLAAHGTLYGEVDVGAPPRTYKLRATDISLPSAGGRVLIMDDITAEREMAQIQRDFIAMIGHELRTPLTVIKGFAKILLKRGDRATAEQVHDSLETIDSKAEQLERLIEDLLYVSRIESREAPLRVEQVDVTSVVRSVVDALLAEHPERAVSLDIPSGLVWPCDETKVALVLRHLVENALEYSSTPHPVFVSARVDGALEIDVIDHGVGIVSSDIPHIFERFRQLDSSSTREHGGTGVGLYLCAQLVRAHGGDIWVDSTWGRGSKFSFSLPLRHRSQPSSTSTVGVRGNQAVS